MNENNNNDLNLITICLSMIAQFSDELARIESEAEAALLQILEENKTGTGIISII